MANLKQFIQSLENQETQTALIAIEDKVIVKVLEAPNTSKGGIIIPDGAKEEEQEGIVLATGTHKLNGEPVEVKTGQYIMFPKFAGVPLTVDGMELRCIRHSDISLVSRIVRINENREFTTKEEFSSQAIEKILTYDPQEPNEALKQAVTNYTERKIIK